MNRPLCFTFVALALAGMAAAPPGERARKDPAVGRVDVQVGRPLTIEPEKPTPPPRATPRPSANPPAPRPAATAKPPAPAPAPSIAIDPATAQQAIDRASYVLMFTVVSLAPAAVLMLTAFVRINVVLVLLRQALGSPQVPGNQVLTALALLLTALIMRPVGETVYTRAVAPLANHKITWTEAYREASLPIKTFMLDQIERTNHANYVWALYDEVVPDSPGRPTPVNYEDFPMRVVAPAFLLSELTTALVIGFYLYLPFLVVDLVVSAVLAAMGLFMLPPSMVSLPLKLILFVVADGWLHVATMLLRSFGPTG